MVNDAVDSKNNKEEKTKKVADMRIITLVYVFFLTRMQYAVAKLVDMRFFLYFQHVWANEVHVTWWSTTPSGVYGKDNLEEKTRDIADIRMCHLGSNFLQLGRDMLCWLWLTFKFYTFNMSENIKEMLFGGQWHSGWQG